MFVDFSVIEATEIASVILVTVFSVGSVKTLYAIFANKVAACAKNTIMESTGKKAAGGFMIAAGGYLIVKA